MVPPDSMRPLPNYFGLLFSIVKLLFSLLTQVYWADAARRRLSALWLWVSQVQSRASRSTATTTTRASGRWHGCLCVTTTAARKSSMTCSTATTTQRSSSPATTTSSSSTCCRPVLPCANAVSPTCLTVACTTSSTSDYDRTCCRTMTAIDDPAVDLNVSVLLMHEMHEMQTIAIDDPLTWCVSLCRFMWLHCENTAEWIEILLRVKTLGDPRNIVLLY